MPSVRARMYDEHGRMLSPAHVITHTGGVARGAFLQRFGFTRSHLSRAVREGSVIRIRRGVFATDETAPLLVRAAAHGGAVTCAGALRLHGIWVLNDDDAVHVWLGANGRVHHRDCDCVGHWFDGPTILGLAPVDDALVHVFACHGAETFFAALESALRQRKVHSIGLLRSRLPASARWLVDLARNDADSGLESLLRLRLHILGIRLDCQVRVPGVGRVDFVIGGRLILETDGAEHHGNPSQRHRDLVRDAAASAAGFESLRFDYALVVYEWPKVQAAIVAALARMG